MQHGKSKSNPPARWQAPISGAFPSGRNQILAVLRDVAVTEGGTRNPRAPEFICLLTFSRPSDTMLPQ